MAHDHSHVAGNYNRAFAIGIALNVVFVAVEAGYGVFADSLALLADAGHNLSDVFSLLIAWGASAMATKAVTERRTYGFKKLTVLAPLASAIMLIAALGGITWEAVMRLRNPQPVAGSIVIIVAGVGVVINTVTALLFFSGQKHDLNIKGAFIHMAADAGVSLGVVAAGIIIMLKGWLWIDPVISFVIVAIVMAGTWELLKDSINLAIDAVPEDVDIAGIKDYLNGLENVLRFHDLHVWALSTTQTALTVHILVKGTAVDNDFLQEIHDVVHKRFNVEHTTIQLEYPIGGEECISGQDCAPCDS